MAVKKELNDTIFDPPWFSSDCTFKELTFLTHKFDSQWWLLNDKYEKTG
jgi:hypothetical protein